ncbi:AI-2E family transporter [Arcanobacterium pinnipediorum]|uniref:AI-2E family transporter n=1 Tax=Arcanobacterium pinnipediorum TaxID=1503041 RepID=A0ABY5AHN0_9ACTO|nr:AI-2E family transporter [Arcanobacterium pinnipediorum]USR78764.1 AI-2E family transporter [Arcanobacterium pinnipediorum]
MHATAEDYSVSRVPQPLRTLAAWSWRLLVVGLAFGVLGWLSIKFYTLLISVMVAFLLAVVLEPLVAALKKYAKFPASLAAGGVLLSSLGIFVVLMWSSSVGIVSGFTDISEQLNEGISTIVQDLTQRFPHLGDRVNDAWGSIQQTLTNNSSQILGGVVAVGSTVTSLVTGFLLTLFTLFFFLKDGRRLWHWCVRLLPMHYQNSANEAGIRAWVMIGNYTRTQALVALIDALGIAGIAMLLETPMSLALPIGVIVFVAAFIPVVGAFLSGFVAIIIVLVNTQSFFMAAMMAVGILFVQQLEGNLLQPILQGNALNIHPLAIVLIVAAGSAVAGIVGAIFTVPIVAALNVIVLYLRGHDMYPYLDSLADRPGGPPRDFLELREEYWLDFSSRIAVTAPPAQRRKAKRDRIAQRFSRLFRPARR